MLGAFLLVAAATAALCFMVGLTDLAKRIAIAVFGLALLAPILEQMISGVVRATHGWSFIPIVITGLGAACVSGFKRFVDHRRALHHWVGEKPTSLKSRVEDE